MYQETGGQLSGTCDVCSGDTGYSEVDVTSLSANVVRAVQELNSRNVEDDISMAVTRIEYEVRACTKASTHRVPYSPSYLGMYTCMSRMSSGWLVTNQKVSILQAASKPREKKCSEYGKVFGMRSAISKGCFTFYGWPLNHVVNCLWGSKGKLLSVLGHHEMCVHLSCCRVAFVHAYNHLFPFPIMDEGWNM